jgi:predicted HicB family RNase H-like nuclease
MAVPMKYNIEIDIEPKHPVIPLNLRFDEKTVREFKYVAKQNGVSMTHVITQMLREFVNDYREKGKPKQRSMF